MSANELRKITDTIKDKDFLESVYEKLILPLLSVAANDNKNVLYINGDNNKFLNGIIGDNFKNNSIWGLCKGKMKPLLVEKGFKVQDVSDITGVAIYW